MPRPVVGLKMTLLDELTWPLISRISDHHCMTSHYNNVQTHTHTQTHTTMQVLFFFFFHPFQKKKKNWAVSKSLTAYCIEKQRSWMFHWYISDVILYEWRVSMQLDYENYLPTGIQRKKKTILSGCFLYEKRIMMMHCQFLTAVFEKVMTTTTAMKIPSVIHSSYTTWLGIAHTFGYIYISD